MLYRTIGMHRKQISVGSCGAVRNRVSYQHVGFGGNVKLHPFKI